MFDMRDVPTRTRHYPSIWINKKIAKMGYFIEIILPVYTKMGFMFNNLMPLNTQKFCI